LEINWEKNKGLFIFGFKQYVKISSICPNIVTFTKIFNVIKNIINSKTIGS